MAKKESAKRGYMTPEEVEGHIDQYLRTEKSMRHSGPMHERELYLRRILKHEKLLSQKTKGEVYNKLLEVYMDDRPTEDDLNNAEEIATKMGERGRKPLMTILKHYMARGYSSKVERVAKTLGINDEKVTEMFYRQTGRSWKKSKHNKGNLTSRVSSTTAIIGIIGGLFFFSANMTGNVIGNLTTSGEKVIGSIFVLVALVGAFFWMRSK